MSRPAWPRGRILHVLQPAVGGVPGYVAVLARALADRGWKVTVAAPREAVGMRELASAGIVTVDLDVDRAIEPRRDLVAALRLAGAARLGNIDLMHGHSTKANAITAVAARLAGVQSIYTPHAWAFQRRQPAPVRAMNAAAEAVLCNAHTRIIAVCAAEAAAAEHWNVVSPRRLRVVHTGLPPHDGGPQERSEARVALGLRQDDVVIAWVGRAGSQKRPEELLPLAARLPPQVAMLALGHGLADAPVAAALRAAGVRVLDPATPVQRLLAGADVFVHTSAWEGFPLVVLEAMRAGLPVVAYDVGGVVEQVEDQVTGYLVRTGDRARLARRTAHLVSDPDLRARLGAAGARRFAARFSIEGMVEGVERVYEEALDFGKRVRSRTRWVHPRSDRA